MFFFEPCTYQRRFVWRERLIDFRIFPNLSIRNRKVYTRDILSLRHWWNCDSETLGPFCTILSFITCEHDQIRAYYRLFLLEYKTLVLNSLEMSWFLKLSWIWPKSNYTIVSFKNYDRLKTLSLCDENLQLPGESFTKQVPCKDYLKWL